VSTAGGEQVRWARKGSELFYIDGDRRLTAVSIKTSPDGGSAEIGARVPLFQTTFDATTYQRERQQYAVSPDGQRFLMNVPTDIREPSSIVVILNWKGNPYRRFPRL
jgi:hypothetical protein